MIRFFLKTITNPLLTQVKNCVYGYVGGELTLNELTTWLGDIIYEIDDETDEAASQLAYMADLLISEYHDGHLTEVELQTQLDAQCSLYN